jgi:formylglycine-generating enzyme required for sulfatase activity
MPAKLQPPLVPGAAIGPYRIASVPDGGAVGEAIDSTQKRVAIKRLPDALVDQPEKLAQYRELVQSVNALRHRGILTCHGVEVYDGAAYVIMEFAARGSLVNQIAALGRLPWLEATRRLIEVAHALEVAHARNIVHGDIRPSNLLIDAENRLRVCDFAGGLVEPRTRDYAAPELFTGSPPTPAADVYSLGATYFALLTGHAPFADAGDEAAIEHAHLHARVPNVRAGIAEMPLRCEMIIQRAMAKPIAERYASVASMRADLEAVLLADQAMTAPAVVKAPTKVGLPQPSRSSWFKRRSTRIPGASLLVLIGLCAVAYFVFPLLRQGKNLNKDKSENPVVEKRPAITNVFGMRLIQVPSGVFSMGDAILADARPHPIRISKPFFIGATEVTQREFQAVMGSNPSQFQNEKSPVDSVTWEEARDFCERLSKNEIEKRASRSYRLPTEAEWEFACRAGTRTHFAFGNQLRLDQANTRSGGTMRSTPAGTFPPNGWGLLDMHGNLWEWCSDLYKSDYYAASPLDDPQGPTDGTRRVVRGGSWMVGPDDCLSARRGDLYLPTQRSPDVGFRVVCIALEFESDEK